MRTSSYHSKGSLPLIVMLVLFASIGFMAWFGIAPLQRFITEKADGIQEYYATRENQKRQIARLPDLEQQFTSIIENERMLDILLPEDKIVDFVKTLEGLALATSTHVKIEAKDEDAIVERKNIPPARKTTDEAAGKKQTVSMLDSLPYERYLHVNIIVTGEYRNIMTFLHRVETLPLGLDIIGLEIRTKDKEDDALERPDNPGGNAFLIFSDASIVGEDALSKENAEQVVSGPLEATFDTVVYVSK